MSDNEEDIFAFTASAPEASSLVSKWLADSEDDESSDSGLPVAQTGGRSTLSRLDGIGLGAEDLNDLVAQRRLAPTERKMKYRLEASEKLKIEREKETLAMAKKLEDDVFDNDSKTVQASKKRSRAFSKNAVADMHGTAKKKVKLEKRAAEPVVELIVSTEVHQTEEVVFDFTKTSDPETPVKVESKPEKSSEEKKHSKSKDSSKHKNVKDKKDKKEKKDHKKSHKK